LELLGDIKGERAEDKTKLGDKDAFKYLEDILKIDEGEGKELLNITSRNNFLNGLSSTNVRRA